MKDKKGVQNMHLGHLVLVSWKKRGQVLRSRTGFNKFRKGKLIKEN
jgi:hypothetical protein